MQDLSEKLKSLRIKKGLSQSQVVELLGITPSAVSSYECAIRIPTIPLLIRFASLYHVSTDYLLGVNNSHKQLLELDGLTTDEIEILKRLSDILRENHKKKN